MEYSYQVVRSVDQFRNLKVDWERLNALCPKGCFFTSWYWMFEWWVIYSGKTDRLFLVCAFNGTELLGIGPFYIKRVGPAGAFNELRFIGSGEADYKEVMTEYPDLLFHPDHESKVLEGLMRSLFLEGDWDKLVLDNLLATSAIRSQLRKSDGDIRVTEQNAGLRYRVNLPLDYAEYVNELSSSNTRSKIKRSRKRFEKGFSGSVLMPKNLESVDRIMSDLKALHETRWQSKGKGGAFVDGDFVRFHRAIANHCFSMGGLVLVKLEVAEQVVAVFYGWRYKDTVSYYQSGIDTDFKPNLSPGYVMHSLVIEQSIEQGAEYYDLMSGGVDSYKSTYGCEKDPLMKAVLFNDGLKGHLLFLVEGAAVEAKKLVKKIMGR